MADRPYSLAWPTAHGAALISGIFKKTPADFQVEEQLPFTPTGQGEHVLLHIRKMGLNTQDVARRIARCAKLSDRLVSYAGLKDKHAVTTQWFSVQVPIKTAVDWSDLAAENLTVLQAVRHDRKLRRGAVATNRFVITLREVAGDIALLNDRLQRIATTGVPNYFGAQRFGRDAQNLPQAERLFANHITPPRFERGMYLSAARSWLFNQVLAERIQRANWEQPLPGDVFWLQGTKRFFSDAPGDANLLQRVTTCDIHPTGPLWGKGELLTQAAARELELSVINSYTVLAQGLEAAGLEQDRRALRVMPLQFEHAHDPAAKTLTLRFELPAGAYATAVLREFAALGDTSTEPEAE
jgi:tRNA pseudouridine13 synthase